MYNKCFELEVKKSLDIALKHQRRLTIKGPEGSGKTSIVQSWIEDNKDKINSIYFDGTKLKDHVGLMEFAAGLILTGELFTNEEIDKIVSTPNLVIVVDNYESLSINAKEHVKLLMKGYLIDRREEKRVLRHIDNLEFVCAIENGNDI